MRNYFFFSGCSCRTVLSAMLFAKWKNFTISRGAVERCHKPQERKGESEGVEGDTIRWNDKWYSSTALYTLDDDRCEGAFRDNNLYDGRRLSPRARQVRLQSLRQLRH